MANLTSAEAAKLNKMCPVAKAVSLGTKMYGLDGLAIAEKTGVGAGSTIALNNTGIIGIVAFVSASSLFSKVLVPATDYTYTDSLITCVTAQTANKLVVLYKA